jgi:hypothetical protein
LKQAGRLRVRIPEFTRAGEMQVVSGGQAIPARAWGNYLELGERLAGDFIQVTYPLPITTEDVSIGNPGFRQYRYRVTWKGDSVVKIEPLGNDDPSGYSDYDKRQVPVFYGKEGPGPLYQRESMLPEVEPVLSPISLDQSPLVFWYFGGE